MKVLVTGATGFLGSHLVRLLLARADEVVALCRDEDEELSALGVAVVVGDVLDGPSVERAAQGCEGLFHCAGRVSRNPADAEALYRLHVEGTRTVLAAARKAGVRRVVVASTSGTVAVSDDPDHISTEDDDAPMGIIAQWPYYRAKLFAERVALEMNAVDFEVISVNPTLLLGPGDTRGSSTDDVRLFLERRVPVTPGGGLSYVDVRDAANALRLAMDLGEGGRRYLVGACNLTVREFFARLERVSGVKAPVLSSPRLSPLGRWGASQLARLTEKYTSVDPVSVDMAQYFWYMDATRAETELGWKSRDPVATLGDTVADLRARGVSWG